MAELPKATNSRNLGNLSVVWHFALQYPWRIAGACLALLVAAAATLAIPAGFQQVIDQGFGGHTGPTPLRSPMLIVLQSSLGRYLDGGINFWFELLLLTVIVLALATATRFYFVSWLGERVIADLRAAVLRNLVTLSPSFFEENRPSEIASRLTADTSIIEQIVGTTVSVALRNLVIGIGGIGYLFTVAPRLTGMLLIGIPVIILPIVILGRRLQAISRQSQDRIADVGSVASETLGAMKVVQAFGQEQREIERFSNAVENTFSTAQRRIALRSVMTAVIITLIFGSITTVMWQGALDVVAGRLTGGSIAAFVLTGGLVAGAFGALTEVYGDLLRGSAAAGRLAELLNERPTIAAPAFPLPMPENAQGRVSFEHVTFRYPTRPEVSALSDFSLDIAPGETVAVVGPSGAGKTTLFQLIQRFYDPASGKVCVDGVALQLTDPAQVRARIAMVPQETVIFAASARDNLRYGRWDSSDDALWDAAEAANAAEFLRKLPDGLDTFMGEGGARLSGGQRQRLAIARAILRNAPILLLDEATSALDAESERLVQDALDRLMTNRTTIVIAHRLATVRAADRIIVMSDGKIVEEGNHESLSRSDGLYARLARLQFEGMAA
ncbi:ATP-binding cassette domain-containing protein [Sphingomonas paeninsulae]|jgi:ATP-binding cassette subfamily B protein|uniref:ATP-binding cassette domain-containing protein n=1 Tax=Sphingomonas paeninsulae TaxID=2319844 RepID=A0A494TAI1_SPHPE|nr:ABC transporter transmembrane domain-containing protein [Sphingomonas paeninsulae]AYJ86040.1 ATP-binding cassette domain-containing protein [Sphingomonas paeninsulae]